MEHHRDGVALAAADCGGVEPGVDPLNRGPVAEARIVASKLPSSAQLMQMSLMRDATGVPPSAAAVDDQGTRTAETQVGQLWTRSGCCGARSGLLRAPPSERSDRSTRTLSHRHETLDRRASTDARRPTLTRRDETCLASSSDDRAEIRRAADLSAPVVLHA